MQRLNKELNCRNKCASRSLTSSGHGMELLKRAIALLVLALLLAALFAFFFWARTQLSIDSCLDLGGRWDYTQDSCDVTSKHE